MTRGHGGLGERRGLGHSRGHGDLQHLSRPVRLSYCYPTPERIREGVRRLATVVNAEADLARLFGTHAVPDEDTRDAEYPSPDLA